MSSRINTRSSMMIRGCKKVFIKKIKILDLLTFFFPKSRGDDMDDDDEKLINKKTVFKTVCVKYIHVNKTDN